MAKVNEALQGRQDDLSREAVGGTVAFESFRQALHRIMPGVLNDHEIISIARCFQDQKDDDLNVDTLIAVAQEQLRKNNFENFTRVHEQCVHYDKERYVVFYILTLWWPVATAISYNFTN